MTITAVQKPVALTWGSYTSQAKVIDPADGTEQDAFTAFEYELPDAPTRTLDGQVALADGLDLTITPIALVRTGASKTADLLSHEQFHYDVGFVIARVVAKKLARLRAATEKALVGEMQRLVQYHFNTRAGLIQRRYDIDTHHGTNKHYQKLWKGFMRNCLADAKALQIHGFWL